jgi:DNA-directed RNA polymerase specialized sigma24 family protein
MAETVLELTVRTAISDAYRDAARIVREQAVIIVNADGDVVEDAVGDLVTELESLATNHPKTTQEWWAGAQVDVAAVTESNAALRRAIDALPAHGDVAVMMLEYLVARGIGLLHLPDAVEKPLVAATRAAIEEVSKTLPR